MIYISGKISNDNPEIQKNNLDRFFIVEEKLNSLGFKCFNPARYEFIGGTWARYLAKDLKWIEDNRPTLYMMKGWQDSKGAMLEFEYAQLLGLEIIYEP